MTSNFGSKLLVDVELGFLKESSLMDRGDVELPCKLVGMNLKNMLHLSVLSLFSSAATNL